MCIWEVHLIIFSLELGCRYEGGRFGYRKAEAVLGIETRCIDVSSSCIVNRNRSIDIQNEK